jgi:hypothetical protein
MRLKFYYTLKIDTIKMEAYILPSINASMDQFYLGLITKEALGKNRNT